MLAQEILTMGIGLRAQAMLREQNRVKREAEAKALAKRKRDAARFAATYLDRHRAAARCGLSVHGFKRQQLAGRGPRPTKMGSTQQSRTYWHVQEIDAWLQDPATYERQRSAEATQPAGEAGTG